MYQKTIFILEQDDSQGDVFHKFLADQKVILSKTVPEALHQLEKGVEKIDLFISDIFLPDLKGLEFRKFVLDSEKFREVPFIFLTEHLQFAEKVQELSPYLVLTKPIQGQDVKKIVTNLFLEMKA